MNVHVLKQVKHVIMKGSVSQLFLEYNFLVLIKDNSLQYHTILRRTFVHFDISHEQILQILISICSFSYSHDHIYSLTSQLYDCTHADLMLPVVPNTACKSLS